MSLLPFSFFRRSSVHDMWHRPIVDFGRPFFDMNERLDMHDPFDELDLMAGNNIMWLHRPSFIRTFVIPRIPEKYRITVSCNGFNPQSIKTEVVGQKVFVTAKEENRVDRNNYTMKEFKKSYDLPYNAQTERLTSYVVGRDQLVIEVPLKNANSLTDEAFAQPSINQEKKSISIDFNFPEFIDPSKISVVCKDNDLIIKADDHYKGSDKMSHFSYYKRITMPNNTDFYELKCKMDKNVLSIDAPLLSSDFKNSFKKIPIQNIEQEKVIEQSSNL